MKNNENNGESTPNPLAEVTVEFPRVQDVAERAVVKFGERKEILRVSETATVEIDAYWFTGPKVLKLKKIKPALAGVNKAGNRMPDGKEYNAKWFDDNVRDPFHKVLRYAAKQSIEHGEPVSVGFTRRNIKATGEQIVTAKHGFEFRTKLANPAGVATTVVKQLADQAKANEEKAKGQSQTRAKRQSKNKPLVPVITPEAGNRIDALIAKTDADKAAVVRSEREFGQVVTPQGAARIEEIAKAVAAEQK